MTNAKLGGSPAGRQKQVRIAAYLLVGVGLGLVSALVCLILGALGWWWFGIDYRSDVWEKVAVVILVITVTFGFAALRKVAETGKYPRLLRRED